MKQNLTFNKWIDYYYKLENQILTERHIIDALFSLFEIFPSSIEDNSLILIQFKIKFLDNNYRSISYLQSVTINDLNELKDIFIEFWNLRDEDYISLNPSHIIFTYKIINNDLLTETKLNRSRSVKTVPSFNFKGYNLPKTMDYSKWGLIISETTSFCIVKKQNSKLYYHINIYENYLSVDLNFKDKTIFKFTDTLIEKGKLDSFSRKFNNQEYIFIDGKLTIKKIIKHTKYLNKLIPDRFINDKFLTMDLETRTINGNTSPYCVSIYDGSKATTFYLLDYKTSDEMLISSIKFLMKPKYHNYKIYLHNFSFFDAIFLMRPLSELTNILIKPVIRDGRIIDLKFPFSINNKNFNIFFRDSFLLLPDSLKKLAKNFNVDNKDLFPYLFVNNPNIPLDYKGSIPSFDSFIGISLQEYEIYKDNYINRNWELRSETIKYCEQDCITLHQIISKFQNKIFILFRINILKYPTLASLAFAIYRTKFIPNSTKIPLLDGDLFTQIKKGYTGGSVDVYKPSPEKDEIIYRYDVNSLYPFVMKNYLMPIGEPIYFEGDLSLIGIGSGYELEKQPFGFFEVEITAPDNLNIPLLQTRLKTNNGTRTVAPLGTWTGTYFSEEIFNAMKYGYKFKILRGYLFDKDNIFSDYVDFLYELKLNSSKSSPDYIISKLLLNTLYGRFGMDPKIENHMILSNIDSLKVHNQKIITNVIDLHNGKELISFFDDKDWNEETKKKTLNISIAISAAVTAYARIHMSQFKSVNNDYNLYYSDTDSIDINKPLPDKFIGEELGKIKLEHIFNDAVFLAPKVYGGVTNTYEYVKVKGLKNPVQFNQLKPLLIKDSKLEVKHEKWYRSISKANISIKQEIYTLMVNNNKRKLIYDNNNKFIDTSPILLKSGIIE